MCFYNRAEFACGDIRWTNFAALCHHETRTGDTCGLKLANSTEQVPGPCRLCAKIETKARRRAAEITRLNRWKREGSTRVVSMDKSRRLCLDLEQEIRHLERERSDRRITFGKIPDLPPLELPPVPSVHGDEDVLAGVYSDSGYHSTLNPSSAKQNVTSNAEHVAEVDDTRTEYSEASTVAMQRNEAAVSELADDLFKKVAAQVHDARTMRQIIDILPDVLKAFALRIGYKAPTQIHRDIMFFIHKHRHQITASFWDRYSDEMSLPDTSADNGPRVPPRDLIIEWLKNLDDDAEDHIPISEVPDWEDDHEPYDASDHVAYRNLILQSPAYKWLLERLLRETHLDTDEANTQDEIREGILFALPVSPNISRKCPSQTHQMVFEVEWDPIQFIAEQRYEEGRSDAFERAITLTGSVSHAQALTCGQYLRQTWPFSGDCMIGLLREIINSGPGHVIIRTLMDRSTLTGTLIGSRCIIEAVGSMDHITEIGEQLAWVGAALRSAPLGSGVAYSKPYIHDIQQCNPYTDDGQRECVPRTGCKISFTIHPCQNPNEPENGACWHKLFRNPVLVPGFPIPHRPDRDTGLQIPLEMMTTLAQAQRPTLFQGKICFKGFSVILVPTKRAENCVLWHMLFNEDGSRISYSDDRIPGLPGLYPDGLRVADLHTATHILGWCSHAEDLTGSPRANYDIGWSRLGRPDVGCDFEKVSITRGKLITGGTPVAIGLKDRPAHIQVDNYAAQIRWIAKKYVVLYDAGDRRAWFVDGVSTLLHLVRASLKENEKDDPYQQFLLSSQALVEASQSLTGKAAAISVLINPSNRNLELYTEANGGDKSTSGSKLANNRLEDRVNQVFHTLEQIFDHQAQVNVELVNGFRGDASPQRLEGFDFMDIATEDDQFWSHMSLLGPDNVGWTDFTRSVHAITLFGRGFGQLIRPANPHQICHSWREVPKDEDLLAASVPHLAEILRKRGNPDTNPWQLVEGTFWHMVDKSFEDCQCASADLSECCNRVQLLVSSAQLGQGGSNLTSPSRLEHHGAVIFGPAGQFPVQGADIISNDDLSSSERLEQMSIDSGIGPSLHSMAESRGDKTPPGKRKRPSGFQHSSARRSPPPFNSTSSPLIAKRGTCDDYVDNSQARREDSPPTKLAMPAPTAQFGQSQQYSHSTVTTPPDSAYKVGWICALKVELDAALRMLDAFYGRGFGHGSDNNIYTLGRIGEHNVVITCLPMGRYGNNSAAIVATRMTAKFPNIRIGLLVGIGGGIPNETDDIRLGDVVVSKPGGGSGGVIQYDLGKITVDGLRRTGFLGTPPEIVLAVLNLMPSHGSALGQCSHSQYPGEAADTLFEPTYRHVSGRTCTACDPKHQIERAHGNRKSGPRVFYGTIASGNAVIKDARVRDELGTFHGALCFEMEAAGVMDSTFPCIVIRGISDYADSHKADTWIEYAAATAAGYARGFLQLVPPMV
ncbi:hypothetical protein BJY00DRAFT_136689 [Aspergillus carlsbadensis]|nr:hypothetical protein BJY00DRAFT_136689 [Aspergillus carlsbadensis]